MSGPREEDGDYAREFFDRAADALTRPIWTDLDEDEQDRWEE